MTILSAFLPGLLREIARHDVAGAARAHQVEWHRCELKRRATLQKQDVPTVVQSKQPAQRRLCVVDDVLECGAAVAHFHDRHATALIVKYLGGCLAKNLLRQTAWPCGEVVNTRHV